MTVLLRNLLTSLCFFRNLRQKQRATTTVCPAGRARCPLVENLGFRHRAMKLVCNSFTSEIRLEKHPRIDDDETKPFRQCIVVFSNVRGLVRQEKFCYPRLGNRTSLIIGIQQILCSRSNPVVARGLWGRFSLWWWPRLSCLAMPGHAAARWCRGGLAVLFGSVETRGGAASGPNGRTRDVYRMQGTHFCGFFSEALKTSLTRDETFSKVESTAEWH